MHMGYRIVPCLAALLALVACGSGQMRAGAGGEGEPEGSSGVAASNGVGMWRVVRDALDSTEGGMVDVEIMDEAGFGQPIVAARLQVPAGWRTAGGIRWNDAAECFSGQVYSSWSASSPDNASVLEVLPGFAWQIKGTQIATDPCPVATYRSAREFLEAAAQHMRPGARVLDYSDWPELVQKTEEKVRQEGVPLGEGQRRRFEAGRLLVGYRAEGVEMREVFATVVSFMSLGNKQDGSAGRLLAYRAPNGRLDLGFMDDVVASFQENRQWTPLAMERVKGNVQRYFTTQRQGIDSWHARRMAEINARGEADRAAIRSQTVRDVAAIRSQTHANTIATNDGIHARTIDGIYERNTYAGADGNTEVHSSIHGGQRVFQENNNPYNAWSTDDPYAQPADATELSRIR